MERKWITKEDTKKYFPDNQNDLNDPDRFERIQCENGVLFITKNYKGPIAIDARVEWGGNLRCNTSDGRNVKCVEELNHLEKEKKNEIRNNVF